MVHTHTAVYSTQNYRNSLYSTVCAITLKVKMANELCTQASHNVHMHAYTLPNHTKIHSRDNGMEGHMLLFKSR